MKGIKPNETEIAEMQSYYNDNHTAREVAKKFGRFHGTVLKYITVRRPHISEEEKRQRRIDQVVSWRQRTKQKLVKYKGGNCKSCGYSRCIDSLTFHHLDPLQKEFTISGTSKSFETLKAEADKCILLCRNCHGEVHAGMLQV